MTNYIQKGETITMTAPYATLSNAGCLVGTTFGVATNDVASGAVGQYLIVGVVDLAKDTSTFVDGDFVFWDNTAKKATSTTTGNNVIGYATLIQPDLTSALGGASGDATVRVRLNGRTVGSNPAEVQTATVALTAANILAMFATPITLIAAPGAGKAIVVESLAVELILSATAFASGGVVHFYYHGLTVELMSASLAAATVNGAAGTSTYFLTPVATAGGSVISSNLGIDITNATGAFTTGTGTAKVFIKYRVVTL